MDLVKPQSRLENIQNSIIELNPREPRRLKVKTGCFTCKSRKIKCDEAKPTCAQCFKAKVICQGYRDHTPRRSYERHLSGEPNRPPLRSLVPISSLLPGETLYENQYFQYFREGTNATLSNVLGSAFCSQLLLQGYRQEPFIRYAVIAIAALQRSHEIARGHVTTNHSIATSVLNQSMTHQEYALREYNKSLKAMRIALSSQKANIRTNLLACLLVYCFESLLGDRCNALLHARNGTKMIHDWLLDNPNVIPHTKALSSPRPEIVEDILLCVFGQLDIQCIFANDARPAEIHKYLKNETVAAVEGMPAMFSNLVEAKRYLDLIIRRACHFCTVLSMSRDDADDDFFTAVHLENQTYISEVASWLNAFKPFMRRICQGGDKRKRWGALILQLNAIGLKISVLSILFKTSTAYDNLLPEFRSIVNLSEECLQIQRKLSDTNNDIFDFIISPGVGNALRMVAFLCRDREIRRDAIALLKVAPREEGIWHSRHIAAFGEWMMLLEEGELGLDQPIPEWKRIRIISLYDDPKRRQTFMCVRQQISSVDETFLIKTKSAEW